MKWSRLLWLLALGCYDSHATIGPAHDAAIALRDGSGLDGRVGGSTDSGRDAAIERVDAGPPLDVSAVELWVMTSSGPIHGVTLEGEVVAELPLPPLPGFRLHAGAFEVEGGHLYLLNGLPDGYLSTYDFATGTWSHRPHEDLYILHNGGGVARMGDAVYVTDSTLRAGVAGGVVRFSLDSDESEIFLGEVRRPWDVSAGIDGRLRVLVDNDIFALSPATGHAQLEVTLPDLGPAMAIEDAYCALAVAPDATILVTAYEGHVLRVASDGSVLAKLSSLTVPDLAHGVTDVDVRSDGFVVVAGRRGHLFYSTVDLETAEIGAELGEYCGGWCHLALVERE
jgi:hypothetical protein